MQTTTQEERKELSLKRENLKVTRAKAGHSGHGMHAKMGQQAYAAQDQGVDMYAYAEPQTAMVQGSVQKNSAGMKVFKASGAPSPGRGQPRGNAPAPARKNSWLGGFGGGAKKNVAPEPAANGGSYRSYRNKK